MKVDRYVEPSEFDKWKQVAEDLGFLYVASGPLVRSSYKVGIPLALPTDYIYEVLRRPANITSRMYCAVKVLRRNLTSWRRRKSPREI